MTGGRFSSGAGRTALCGVLIALSTVLLYLSSLVPSGRIGVAAVAGLFPTVAVMASGRGAGLLCWAGSGLLGLLLVPEKWLPLLYLAFLGLYPVVKSVLEGVRSRVLEWLGKLVYFNVVLILFWMAFRALFLPALPDFLQSTPVLATALNIVFVIYDIGLSRLIALCYARLAPILGRKG